MFYLKFTLALMCVAGYNGTWYMIAEIEQGKELKLRNVESCWNIWAVENKGEGETELDLLLDELNWRDSEDDEKKDMKSHLPPHLRVCMSSCKLLWEHTATKHKERNYCNPWNIKPYSLQLLPKPWYNSYHVNKCVDVEHEKKSWDYQSLRYVVNQCEMAYHWC